MPREDIDPLLLERVRQAARAPIPPGCWQPHEFDALFNAGRDPAARAAAVGPAALRHLRDCRACRCGYLARAGRAGLDELLAHA